MTIPFADPALPPSSEARSQDVLLVASLLHLMSHYTARGDGEQPCVKLASVIERHLCALSRLPDADPVLRAALLPEATPAPLRPLVAALPGGVGELMADVIGAGEREHLRSSLELLLSLVQAGPYLVGDRLSLADLAVAAQLSLLRFPASAGAPLAGRGAPGLADNPVLEPLFSWRDRLEALVGRSPA